MKSRLDTYQLLTVTHKTATLKKVGDYVVNNPNSLDNRWNALQFCREQLREADQQLYESFYVKNLKDVCNA